MADADYAACRFSATVQINEEVVLHLLRALSQYCESGRYKQIAWGGTKAKDWRAREGVATFRFSAPTDRSRFLDEAERLLPAKSWRLISTSDSDPATRQR